MERRCAFVIMGVAGAGKSAVGAAAAARAGLPFLEGDAFHPPENVARMASGRPLNDADRGPWIAALSDVAREAGQSCIVACSALNESVRAAFRQRYDGAVVFIHLRVSREGLARRLAARPHHFMPASLLDSQLEALSPPPDAFPVDNEQPFDTVVEEVSAFILRRLSINDE